MAADTALSWGGLALGSTVVVDSAPWIYVLEGRPRFAEKFTGLFEAAARQELELALSTITLSEILAGPYKNGHTALAKRYEKALTSYRVVELSAPIAVLAAQLRARFALKLPDAIQVATALDIGADALVTHDRDFSKVRGLSVLMGD
jgi:predicted nucleic acid-binding protein